MIESISIKNIALIDELSIDFSEHLTVLTGETGAGKSILIGALSLLLGNKADVQIIRTGTSEASVSGIFYLPEQHTEAYRWLQERNIEAEDNRVLIRRTLKQNGRSSAWIQNQPVSRLELESFTALLVDIHGQHDHQSLFKISEHRRFLDTYAGILNEVAAYTELYMELAEIKAKLDTLHLSEKDRRERLDYLSFVIDEIEQSGLKPNEDESLEAEETKLCQYEKLYEQVELLDAICNHESGVVPLLKKMQHLAGIVAEIDPNMNEYADRIENTYYELEDIGSSISSYLEKLVFDPERLRDVQERLIVVNKLKKKYGNSIAEIMQVQERAQSELEQLSDSQTHTAALEQRIMKLEKNLLISAGQLSEKRTAAAAQLETEVQEILRCLGMPNARFSVHVAAEKPHDAKQIVGVHGFDTVTFLISANAGEPPKILNKVASGGELSRIMLALKTVLAADGTDTLIFDEIDTGIGGEVARAVADHLQQLAQKKQILCITHLAVIAACADTHVRIRKIQLHDSSRTEAEPIKEDSRIEEIARMLAGDEISTVSRIHAKELLKTYKQIEK